MATNQYLSSNKTSFFSVEDDDDIDDDDFLKLSRNNRSSSSGGNNTGNQLYNDMESKKQALIEKKKEIEQQSVLSSERALRMLRESEDVGIATADELYHQREQLEQTDRRLDDINSTLKQSQKHIQGIKSVFGGIKNFLSKSKTETLSSPSTSSKPAESVGEESDTKRDLHEAISKAKQSDQGYSHPGLRLRNIEDPTNDSRSTGEIDSQTILDKNLDEMVSSLGRLKGLALGLGEEIDSQNDLVENIISKSERADINIQRQNKDMNRLLKK
ncbi:hypothetical protein WDU94_010291 [Cyamophila willieti]